MNIDDAADIVYAGVRHPARGLDVHGFLKLAAEGCRAADGGMDAVCPYPPGTALAEAWQAGHDYWTRTESKIRTGI